MVARTRAAREKYEPGAVFPGRARANGSTRRDEWGVRLRSGELPRQATCRKCGQGATAVQRAPLAGECQRMRRLPARASVSSVKVEVDMIVIDDEVPSKERLKALEARHRSLATSSSPSR